MARNQCRICVCNFQERILLLEIHFLARLHQSPQFHFCLLLARQHLLLLLGLRRRLLFTVRVLRHFLLGLFVVFFFLVIIVAQIVHVERFVVETFPVEIRIVATFGTTILVSFFLRCIQALSHTTLRIPLSAEIIPQSVSIIASVKMHVVIKQETLQLHENGLHTVGNAPSLIPGLISNLLQKIGTYYILSADSLISEPVTLPSHEVLKDVGVGQHIAHFDLRRLSRIIFWEKQNEVHTKPSEVSREWAHRHVPFVNVVLHDSDIDARNPTIGDINKILQQSVLYQNLFAL
mmetsp:Transcript_59294/g.157870  ORF Transcript_59294/g.157870 Transcript_59294/m.157870 type:complete len:291 (+) Transcript_59294:214-1086(+)